LIVGYELFIKYKHILGYAKGIFASIKLYFYSNIYSSFLAGIVTAPFTVYHFYTFPVYAIAMNLIAVPLMSFIIMPFGLAVIFLMIFDIEYYALKFIDFFVQIILDVADVIVHWPYAVVRVGYITPHSLLLFTLGFLWFCFWSSIYRFLGIAVMLVAITLMVFNTKPTLILSKQDNQIAFLSHDILTIYSEKMPSEFGIKLISDWFGASKVEHKIIPDLKHDLNLYLDDNFSIKFVNKECAEAEIIVDTNQNAKCNGNLLTISHDIWENNKLIAVYCSGRTCYQKPYNTNTIW
jgi:competence protein ComEC